MGDKRDVYLVEGYRTPFLKMRGKPGPFSAADLAVYAGRQVLATQPFAPSDLDSVLMGCMIPSENEANIGRIVALRLGCGKRVPGWTVQRNCASGLQALDSAAQEIALGRYDLVLAGGTDAMSRAPLLYNSGMVEWLSALIQKKSTMAKLVQFLKFRPRYLKPVISLLHGLTDPISGFGMGQTAEEVAYKYQITREAMDAFSLQSHERAAYANDHHAFSEIIPIYDAKGNCYEKDDGIRRDSSLEKLASLKPFFDKRYGRVTAANSSQISDGAAVLLLASATAVRKYNLSVIGRIVDTAWAGCEPTEMGLGPCYAIAKLLQQQRMQRDQIDAWEINEAFAGQVLACLSALQNETFCREELQLDRMFGEIPFSKLNIDGGAIAIGHPVGASGARLVLHLLEILKRQDTTFGVASLCIGGGQGGAMLIERVTGVSR